MTEHTHNAALGEPTVRTSSGLTFLAQWRIDNLHRSQTQMLWVFHGLPSLRWSIRGLIVARCFDVVASWKLRLPYDNLHLDLEAILSLQAKAQA
jgi:hypothetical protein